ncbi:MAG: hypothetical protein E7448_05780 [Ruminococcaceae bacterium]|nr:hypothetical protein [Oscillospiraceae bacterium]
MILLPEVAEWVAAYEQEYSNKPADLVLQIAEYILKVGTMLKEYGRKDAQEGKCAYPAQFFPDLVIKAFREGIEKHPDTVQAVADLWQSDYMDGYNCVIGKAP